MTIQPAALIVRRVVGAQPVVRRFPSLVVALDLVFATRVPATLAPQRCLDSPVPFLAAFAFTL
jgi:hypothetical protein